MGKIQSQGVSTGGHPTSGPPRCSLLLIVLELIFNSVSLRKVIVMYVIVRWNDCLCAWLSLAVDQFYIISANSFQHS